MKISLFGKSLFEVKKSQKEAIYNTAYERMEQATSLIDFYADTGKFRNEYLFDSLVTMESEGIQPSLTEIKGAIKKGRVHLTPKGVHQLKLLNDDTFAVKTDPAYVDEQIETIKDKLDTIKSSDYDMNYGTTELASILMRMENRKQYATHEKFYSEFPYTTPAKIADLIKNHSYLKLGQVAQFIADMPKDAVDIMKAYSKETKKLCGKKAVYYIIADKNDFQKSESRRDPILLAQSPFGHFWQILGAWDEEMIIVDEL
jgi:hypothetical protein